MDIEKYLSPQISKETAIKGPNKNWNKTISDIIDLTKSLTFPPSCQECPISACKALCLAHTQLHEESINDHCIFATRTSCGLCEACKTYPKSQNATLQLATILIKLRQLENMEIEGGLDQCDTCFIETYCQKECDQTCILFNKKDYSCKICELCYR